MQYDIEIREIEVLEDHIHMLATAPPRIAPSRIVQIIKSRIDSRTDREVHKGAIRGLI